MKKIEKVIEAVLFIFVFTIYTFSTSKTITFWDSAEFITSNYHLQSTHPPGAPFYTLFCNFILLFFPVNYATIISNLISSLFGTLTVIILYKIVNFIVSKILEDSTTKYKLVLCVLCGLLSALTLAFSTTFWTIATETEVYTMSTFLLLVSFYIILLWNESKDILQSRRLMLLFIFLLGISVGVHLINLSIIIPLSLLYIHKKENLNWKYIILALFSSTIFFLVIYLFGIQGFLKVASFIDIQLVNHYNLPVNLGMFVLIGFFLTGVFYTIFKTKRSGNIKLYHFTLGILFFAIGASSYLMPILRNNLKTPFSNRIVTSNQLLKYVKAKQFGVDNIPLVKGTIFNAPLDKNQPFLNDEPTISYNNETKKYDITDDGRYSKINYANEFDMFFPRMYSQKPISAKGYTSWINIKGEKITYPVQGKNVDLLKPTFFENLQFFKKYQIDWMYLRYLNWNFIGKQNNNKGTGEVFNGNWVSGFNNIDKNRIGEQSIIPERFKKDISYNTYYFLPFILGLIGIWSLRKHRVYLITSIIFFLTFGIGITIYLNPLPESILIRERDYIFLGSFIIFSLWIGLSFITLYNWLNKITSNKVRIGIVAILVFSLSPLQLLAKNWDDHQRSDETFAYDLGKMYLDSCPKNAILITNGDNFTFPLWYLQEVENYRTDIRVINYDQLNLESYIDKLKYKSLNSESVSFTFLKKNYIEGSPKLFPLRKETKESADLQLVFEFLNNEKTKINWNGKFQHYIPTDIFKINVDSSKMEYNLFHPKTVNANYIPSINWKYTKDFYALNDLVLMDIIQNNIHKKPICFAINGKKEHYLGLQDFMIQNGFIEVLFPMIRMDKNLNPKIVNIEKMYPILMKETTFKELNNKITSITFENKEYIQSIVRRNFYFLAQALIEEGDKEKARQVLNRCMHLFSNETVPFKQFAFALGKLYYRIGDKQKGDFVCLKAMDNIKEELNWVSSFNTNNPIINKQKTSQLKEMYEEMINQLSKYNNKEANFRKAENNIR